MTWAPLMADGGFEGVDVLDWYQVMQGWMRSHRLLVNRVEVINQLLPNGFGVMNENVCTIRYRGGVYTVIYCGSDVCSYKVNNLSSVESAFLVVDSLANVVWDMSRYGLLSA